MFVVCAGEGGAAPVHRGLSQGRGLSGAAALRCAGGGRNLPDQVTAGSGDADLVAESLLPACRVTGEEDYGRSTFWTGWPRWGWATWRRCRLTRGSGQHGRRLLCPAPGRGQSEFQASLCGTGHAVPQPSASRVPRCFLGTTVNSTAGNLDAVSGNGTCGSLNRAQSITANLDSNVLHQSLPSGQSFITRHPVTV